MAKNDRRWVAAIAEHDAAVCAFLAACRLIAPTRWPLPRAPGKWSPAAVALHVCKAYELGGDAVRGGPSMRLLVAPPVAWLSRTLLLPVLFATDRFPRGASSPEEVLPDPAEAQLLTPEAAAARLGQAAGQAVAALRQADGERPAPRVGHAYFGALTPHAALRLLSAHTRHHARGLARPAGARVG